MDIDYGDTLNARAGRDERDEKHICPLQLPTIERLVVLYSNKGDTVLSPFAGIGSEIVKSVELDRYGIGFELKKSYFDEAVKNCQAEELKKKQISLFE
jgi:DNA modification methylase